MYTKKFFFTALTMPGLVYFNRAGDFQARRKAEKEREHALRGKLLNEAPVDITPKNGGNYPFAGQDAHKAEEEWRWRPVQLTGYMDHSKEIKIEKEQNGEKGFECITPFYTHLDKKENPCGLLVNRGWMPKDLHKFNYDKNQEQTIVRGILYRGDPHTKYSQENIPMFNSYRNAWPEQLAVITQLPNRAEAGSFMLKAVDFDENARTAMPDVKSVKDLQQFVIPPQRHAAYEQFWKILVFGGCVANTAMWLYV